MNFKDPKKKLVTFQARKREGHFTNYRVEVPGDFELCFNNKFSMYESKKMMWEFDVEGDEQENVDEILKNTINRTMEVFNEESEEVFSMIKKESRKKKFFFNGRAINRGGVNGPAIKEKITFLSCKKKSSDGY